MSEERSMLTNIANQHWVQWFMYLNGAILALIGLLSLVKILDSRLNARPPEKPIVFDDEFDRDF
jgi:hypothetical protein